jgi:hypothetical protein
MDAEELKRLAMLGARARLVEIDAEHERLNAERTKLIAAFPELGRKQRAPYRINRGPAEPVVLFDADESRRTASEPRKRGRPKKATSDALATIKERAVEMLREGATPPEVAAALGKDRSWIRKLGVAAGISFARGRTGGARKGKGKGKSEREITEFDLPAGRTRRSFSDETKAELVARVRKGEYVIDICREIGIRESMLRRWCEIAGVTPAEIPMDERVRRAQAGRKDNQGES